eukprot:jgi/Bigna1/58029/fgenesh1_pm.48_\
MATTSFERGVRIGAAELSRAVDIIRASEEQLTPLFQKIDSRTKFSLKKVINAFRKYRVNPGLFAGGVDGYGHGDLGRETLDKIYAEIFGAESALVRVQLFSGTHAIACALYGVLRPGDKMLAISGPPYDTLEEVIGLREAARTMTELDIGYDVVELTKDGLFDLDAINTVLKADEDERKIRVLHIQRSCGYSTRKSIPIKEIERLMTFIKKYYGHRHGKDLMVFADNCYGEFVEELEPTHVGVDLIAGSLIKNPGGGLAPSGGYIAGKRPFVKAAMNRLSSPGVSGGAALGQKLRMFQGLFMAPTIVGESLKGAHLIAEVLGNQLGLECSPKSYSETNEDRTDIIQSVVLGTEERVLSFCRAVQHMSPVDAHVKPVPGVTPGYGDPVVFADGTFVFGSTIELSADGPLREPYSVYAQGCVHWTHWALVLEQALIDMKLAS